VAIRTAKLPDPKVIGNAGSFFKNPVVTTEHYTHLLERFPELPSYPANAGHVKLPAAWLIDRAGWKGFREGAVGVHERQALVLVNHGGAHGADVLRLAERIRDSVMERYNVRLEMEVNLW
jgi:UDP-N-acetylmuramate dehydrogenase